MSISRNWLFDRIKNSFHFSKGLLNDKIINQCELETLVGRGFLFCQVREKPNGGRYVVFKSKGGDATIWNGVSIEETSKLFFFLRNNLPIYGYPDNE